MSSDVGMGRSSHARMRIANSNLQRGAVEMDVSRMSLQKFKSWEAVFGEVLEEDEESDLVMPGREVTEGQC